MDEASAKLSESVSEVTAAPSAAGMDWCSPWVCLDFDVATERMSQGEDALPSNLNWETSLPL